MSFGSYLAFITFVVFGISKCSDVDKYAAEVGHKVGDEIVWELWGNFTMEECDIAAKKKYEEFEKLGNAHAWACWKRDLNGSVPLAFSNQGE